MKLLTFEDEPVDWNDYVGVVAEFLSKEYDYWTPVV